MSDIDKTEPIVETLDATPGRRIQIDEAGKTFLIVSKTVSIGNGKPEYDCRIELEVEGKVTWYYSTNTPNGFVLETIRRKIQVAREGLTPQQKSQILAKLTSQTQLNV